MGRICDTIDTLIFVICIPAYALAWLLGVVPPSPRQCPKCGVRALRSRNSIRATCVDEAGRRYPAFYEYHSCESYGARLKIHDDGRTEDPTEEEWSLHVPARPES
jgi:hypothetical protein